MMSVLLPGEKYGRERWIVFDADLGDEKSLDMLERP